MLIQDNETVDQHVGGDRSGGSLLAGEIALHSRGRVDEDFGGHAVEELLQPLAVGCQV